MIDWLLGNSEAPMVALGERSLPLVIQRRANARRMVMRLAPDGSEVRLTVPRWCRTAEALAFARSSADWLEGQLDALMPPAPPLPGGTISYRGQDHRIDWGLAYPRSPQLGEGAIRIGGPAEGMERRLQRWLEKEAVRLMEVDLAHFCATAGCTVPPLGLSRAQRRWGSCSAKGAIRINWRLIQAPDAVRRSVVAHEVAHLLHFDHSPAFHQTLRAIFDDDLKTANRWLKDYGRSLYAAFG